MSRKRAKRSGGTSAWFYLAAGAAFLFVAAVAAAMATGFGPFAAAPAPETKNHPAAAAPQAAPERPAAPKASQADAVDTKAAGKAEAAPNDSVQGNAPAQADNLSTTTGPAGSRALNDRNILTPEEPAEPVPPRSSRAGEDASQFNLWALLPILLSGLLGGLAGAWLVGGSLRRQINPLLRQLADRIGRLEKFERQATTEVERLGAVHGGSTAPPPAAARPFWMKGGDGGGTTQSAAPEERAEARQPRTPLSLEAIAARYSQLVQGNISRSAFDSFFDQFGSATPVDIVDNGRFIQPSVHDDSLLTSVTQDRQALVFPSYAFIANSETLFTTMASAPGPIQHLFDLSKGGGGLALDRPALFEDKGSGLQLVRKGALTGFQG